MRIDIMDRFTFPEVQPKRYNGLMFDINFPEFIYGWLTVQIDFNEQQFTYMASTSYHDLQYMIKAVADLLPADVSYGDVYFHLPLYRTRFVHDLEREGCYCVDLRKYFKDHSTAPQLQILIANQCMDYYGIWDRSYVFNDFIDSKGGWQAIEKTVVFKSELPLDLFCRKFYEACRNLIIKNEFEDHQDKAGNNLSLLYLLKIKEYLKIK